MARGFLRSESDGDRETVEQGSESQHLEASERTSEQLASKMADLVREVTELRAEVTELRAAKPAEGADPAPQEERASESEGGTRKKGFNGDSLARDIDEAMSHLGEIEPETDFGEEDEPEDEPIDDDERKRLELEAFESHPELKDVIAQFNAQDGNSPSSEAATEPEADSGEQRIEETEMDDQVQSESDAMSDDEIQALLAEASAGESKPPDAPADAPQKSDDNAGESTATDDEETQAPVAVAEAGAPEPVSAKSTDEDQSAVADAASESEEPATEAESGPPAGGSDEDSGAEEKPVELGFTAFQAGKDIEESEQEEREEPVAEPPTVPKIPERPSPSMELDPSVIARVPAYLAVGALAVPMRIENDELLCRVVEPFDQEALDRIANALALRVVPEPAPIDEVIKNLRIAYSVEAAKGARTAVLNAAPGKLQKKRSNKKRRKLSRSQRRAA